MCCYPCVEGVHAFQSLGREGEVRPYLSFQPGKKEAPSHIREEADCRLWHCEERPFRGYPYGGVHTETHSTAHGDAIEVGYVRLGICSDQMIQLVFQPEERLA